MDPQRPTFRVRLFVDDLVKREVTMCRYLPYLVRLTAVTASDIGGLAFEVLRGLAASYGVVDGYRTITTIYNNRCAVRLA